mmetsp:Transcript_110396/g.293244  ORF Transcript_110396/g.293244 Transcript_110396/m.293244 type:complete len:282 (+) Transcript_110396:210-1055(+)
MGSILLALRPAIHQAEVLDPGAVQCLGIVQVLKLPAVLIQLGDMSLHGEDVFAQTRDLVAKQDVLLALHLLGEAVAQRVDLADGLVGGARLGLLGDLLPQAVELPVHVIHFARLCSAGHVLRQDVQLPVDLLNARLVSLLLDLIRERVVLPAKLRDTRILRAESNLASKVLHALDDLVRRLQVHLPRHSVVEDLDLLGQLLNPRRGGSQGDLLAERVDLLPEVFHLGQLGLCGQDEVCRLHLLRHVVEVGQGGSVLHSLGEPPNLLVAQLVKAQHLVLDHA